MSSLTIYIQDPDREYCHIIPSSERPYDYLYGFSSLAKFCPRCQRTWAILRFDRDPDLFPDAVYCRTCAVPRPGYEVPGSILNDHSLKLLSQLPLDLLKREFLLHSKVTGNDQ